MADIREARAAVVRRVLEGDGESSRVQRRGAFDDAELAEPLGTLMHKVALHSSRVTAKDIDALRATGMSEDQIFELVVCAALGQANRQYETAMAALDAVSNGSEHAPRDSR
ncbi:MAG TPA: hypothetical protein VK550_31250 [Polyangiaceae bacterium]|nr:hypothetical protein [Polyangiaceae bacterium]